MSRTLLLFGDSNTHGTIPMSDLTDTRRYGREERWAGRLVLLLPEWEVIAEGLPGRTTVHDDPIEGAHRNGRRVLPALLESHRPVEVVLIMLGTNDLKERFGVNAGDIAAGLEQLVNLVRTSRAGPEAAAPGIVLVVPPPITETGCLAEMFSGGAAKSRQLRQRIAEMAGRNNVPCVDAGYLVTVSPTDGIHYDAGANAVLAAAFAQAIRQYFP